MPEYGKADIERMEDEWTERTAIGAESWNWQAFRMSDFRRMLTIAVQRLEPQPAPRAAARTFIDCGCGIGTKVWVAKNEFGLDAFGIDITQKYLDQSRKIGVRTEYWDVRVYPRYHEFDIVYFYSPLRDERKEAAFEQRLYERMRPGAILMCVMPAVKPYSWECLFRIPWQSVWRKPSALYPKRTQT